jgi:hypothetical protein
MPLSKKQKRIIKKSIQELLKLEERISEKREDMVNGDTSPFLINLLGDKNTLLTKVAQSLQTTIGMKFYEQTCKILGEHVGYKVELQKKCKGFISDEVREYLVALDSVSYIPDRNKEIESIRELCRNLHEPPCNEYPDSTVDVYITTKEGKEILIDITTVKPNKKEFRVLKEKILRWTAYRMSQNPDIDIEAFIGIPYNPESANITNVEYSRHCKYYDKNDLLVGERLWKKISNDSCSIVDIVGIFEELKAELGSKVDEALSKID